MISKVRMVANTLRAIRALPRKSAMFLMLAMVGQQSIAATVVNDVSGKTVTITGNHYVLVFNYNLRAQVMSLRIDGVETLEASNDPAQGIYSAAKVGGTWYTTQTLDSSPTVSVNGLVVTASLKTPIAAETWTLSGADNSVSLKISRAYNGAGTVDEQGTPMLNFLPAAFDTIRWPGDASATPIGGVLANAYLKRWLADQSSGYDGLMRTAKEQTSFALLNRAKGLALSVSGSTNHDQVPRGTATEVFRATAANGDHALRLGVLASAFTLQYSSGTPLGYSDSRFNQSINGRVRRDLGPIFTGAQIGGGQVDETTLVFSPATWSTYYDLGTLNGVDAEVISQAINDFGRFTIQDTLRGGSIENSVRQSEIPPLEMHWVSQLVELFPDRAAINALKSGLQDARDSLIDSSGNIVCCRPAMAVPDDFGTHDHDNVAGYVLAVIDVFKLSGDTAWLQSMAASVRSVLNYSLANEIDSTTGLVTNFFNPTASTNFLNDYWETNNGKINGYTSAMLYDALSQWSQVEDDILGSSGNGTQYANAASKISASFNLPISSNGLWSTTTQSFLYGSGNGDVRYLPVNAAVLKSDLATRERRLQIVNGIESDTNSSNLDLHAMNVLDIFNPTQPAPTGLSDKVGENGGWYGATDGDYYSGLPLLNNPSVMNAYIAAFTGRYRADGFYGGGGTDRKNPTQYVDGNDWFSSNIMPLWGLYHYGYGLQPQLQSLLLAPNISPNEVGSVVKYQWRGSQITITFNSQNSWTISAPTMPTNIDLAYINQIPGANYHVRVDGGASYVNTADSNGVVHSLFNMADAGTHTFECSDCVAVGNAGSGTTSLIQSVNLGAAPLRNDVNQQVGMRIQTGGNSVVVKELGRYYVSGNARVHQLKLLNAAYQVIGRAVVDMSAGATDSNGFKYGSLASAVNLSPNSVYYVLSNETQGGDQWYDYYGTLTPTNAIAVAGAVFGQSPTVLGSTGNAYGPLALR